jgi:hypothetical protein
VAVTASESTPAAIGWAAKVGSGSGPPCMATLGSRMSRSTQAAPTHAHGQSTATTRVGVSSRLSARRSTWSRVGPRAAAGQPASRSATIARTLVSFPGRQGRVWWMPSTSSKARATPPSRSSDHSMRGAGAERGRTAMVRASARWIPGLSGFGSGPTALTNARRPSPSRTRTASPGENPLGWVAASTTCPPSRSSTSPRNHLGTSTQSSRRPVAGGTPRPLHPFRFHLSTRARGSAGPAAAGSPGGGA